jgi:uncharacterized protein
MSPTKGLSCARTSVQRDVAEVGVGKRSLKMTGLEKNAAVLSANPAALAKPQTEPSRQPPLQPLPKSSPLMSPLFRYLLMLAIAWYLWHTLRRWLSGANTRTQTTARERQPPLVGGKVVKCLYCELHLPEREALRHNQEWFCNAEHARLYLAKR